MGAVMGRIGIDARQTAEIFARDTVLNVSKAYLRPAYAFGRSCLPKDISAFLALANANDVEVPMLSNILNSNQRQIDRAFDMIATH